MNKKALLIQAVTAAMTVGSGMNFHGQPPSAAYDDNSKRSSGAREFKHKKTRRKIVKRSRRTNRKY